MLRPTLLPLLALGCVADTSELILLPSGGAPPPVRLEIRPSAIDFGTVTIGQRSVRSVRLANRGASSIRASWLAVDPPFEVEAGEIELEGGRIFELAISFEPRLARAQRAELRIDACDGGCETVVELTGVGFDAGTGYERSLICVDQSLAIPVGTCVNADIVCLNDTPRELRVLEASIEGERTVELRESWIGRVPSRGQASYRIEFCPDREGSFQAELVLVAQADDGVAFTERATIEASAWVEPEEEPPPVIVSGEITCSVAQPFVVGPLRVGTGSSYGFHCTTAQLPNLGEPFIRAELVPPVPGARVSVNSNVVNGQLDEFVVIEFAPTEVGSTETTIELETSEDLLVAIVHLIGS
jgi:hypothetical protein